MIYLPTTSLNVGQIVFKRERSKAAFDKRFIESMILQLLAARILKLMFLGDDKKPSLNMTTEEDGLRQPCYLVDKYWAKMSLKEE